MLPHAALPQCRIAYVLSLCNPKPWSIVQGELDALVGRRNGYEERKALRSNQLSGQKGKNGVLNFSLPQSMFITLILVLVLAAWQSSDLLQVMSYAAACFNVSRNNEMVELVHFRPITLSHLVDSATDCEDGYRSTISSCNGIKKSKSILLPQC